MISPTPSERVPVIYGVVGCFSMLSYCAVLLIYKIFNAIFEAFHVSFIASVIWLAAAMPRGVVISVNWMNHSSYPNESHCQESVAHLRDVLTFHTSSNGQLA